MPILLHVHGAAGCVTGACFALETSQGRVLIDCGMFQGSKAERALNDRPFPFDPKDIAAVILKVSVLVKLLLGSIFGLRECGYWPARCAFA